MSGPTDREQLVELLARYASIADTGADGWRLRKVRLTVRYQENPVRFDTEGEPRGR